MSVEIEGVKFYTVEELSVLLKVTRQTVRRYINTGQLKGQRVGKFLVTEKSLHKFLGIEDGKK